MFDVVIRAWSRHRRNRRRPRAGPMSGQGRPHRRDRPTSRATRATVIDATGKVVAPGFIDVHTHFDAQVFWDDALTPSPLHGVTTAFAGNCGFTIAPLSDDPADGEYLMRMLARVEGMPLEALRDGVPWNWKSTGEYFDRIEGTLGINARVHGRPLRHPPRRDGRPTPRSVSPPPKS